MKPAEIELEEMLKKIEKEGFNNIPNKKRVKMLEEQRKQIKESEKCFKTDRKQIERHKISIVVYHQQFFCFKIIPHCLTIYTISYRCVYCRQ